MGKLAIIDLDGIVANNEARFAKADEAANIAELQKYEWPNLRCYGSLAEAMEALL